MGKGDGDRPFLVFEPRSEDLFLGLIIPLSDFTKCMHSKFYGVLPVSGLHSLQVTYQFEELE